MNVENSNPKEWDDVVFENRNKDYGAYLLRKVYVKRVITGIVIANLSIILILVYPALKAYFNRELASNLRASSSSPLESPPPLNKVSPLTLSHPPKIKSSKRFVAPVVTQNEVTEEIKKTDEQKTNTNDTDEIDALPDLNNGLNTEGGEGNIYDFAEHMPQFPGGNEALSNFINRNVRYPAAAQRMRLEGIVHVSFLVDAEGVISDVHAVKGISPECDKEAERLVRLMPPWNPGRQSGKAVRVRCQLPIKFKLGGMASTHKSPLFLK